MNKRLKIQSNLKAIAAVETAALRPKKNPSVMPPKVKQLEKKYLESLKKDKELKSSKEYKSSLVLRKKDREKWKQLPIVQQLSDLFDTRRDLLEDVYKAGYDVVYDSDGIATGFKRMIPGQRSPEDMLEIFGEGMANQ